MDWPVAALFLVLAATIVLFLPVLEPSGAISEARSRLRERFSDPLAGVLTGQPMSPLVVTVYQRWLDSDCQTGTWVSSVGDRLLTLDYSERLIVVKPLNWMVYTNNGINFYLLSNNVSNKTANCDLDRQTIAVDFRLLTVDEMADKVDDSGRLRVACLNYTLDNLVRLFGRFADRTYVDLAAYFDASRNPRAPRLTVDAVVNYLLEHRLV